MMGLMSSQDADLFSDDEVPSRRPVLASPSVQALPTPAKEDPDPDDYPRVVRPSLVQLSAEVSPSLPLTTKETRGRGDRATGTRNEKTRRAMDRRFDGAQARLRIGIDQ
eukprot:g3235.t1